MKWSAGSDSQGFPKAFPRDCQQEKTPRPSPETTRPPKTAPSNNKPTLNKKRKLAQNLATQDKWERGKTHRFSPKLDPSIPIKTHPSQPSVHS